VDLVAAEHQDPDVRLTARGVDDHVRVLEEGDVEQLAAECAVIAAVVQSHGYVSFLRRPEERGSPSRQGTLPDAKWNVSSPKWDVWTVPVGRRAEARIAQNAVQRHAVRGLAG
jgi:hypothetical protein